MIECARMVMDLDARMLSLNEQILQTSEEKALAKAQAKAK